MGGHEHNPERMAASIVCHALSREHHGDIYIAGEVCQPLGMTGVREACEVKRVLVTNHRRTFYQCLTEKLLTYALGRGVEYYDVEAMDQIVAQLEKSNGRFSALLTGIVDSAPFQKRRNISSTTAALPASEERAQAK